MRGPASLLRALLPTKYKLKPINNAAGSSGMYSFFLEYKCLHITLSNSNNYPFLINPGNLAISTPKKLGSGGDSTEGQPITKEKTETAVAFSRPPPLPPFLGPLVALSLIETWLNRDRDDN